MIVAVLTRNGSHGCSYVSEDSEKCLTFLMGYHACKLADIHRTGGDHILQETYYTVKDANGHNVYYTLTRMDVM